MNAQVKVAQTETEKADAVDSEAIAAGMVAAIYRKIIGHTPPLRIGGSKKQADARLFESVVSIVRKELLDITHESTTRKPLSLVSAPIETPIEEPIESAQKPAGEPKEGENEIHDTNETDETDETDENDGNDDRDGEAAFAYLNALTHGTNMAQYVEELHREMTRREAISERREYTRFDARLERRGAEVASYKERSAAAERAIAARRATELQRMRTETHGAAIKEKLPIWVSKFYPPTCLILYILGETPGQYMSIDEILTSLEINGVDKIIEKIFSEQYESCEPYESYRRMEMLKDFTNFMKKARETTLRSREQILDNIVSIAIAFRHDPFELQRITGEDGTKKYALFTTERLADYNERVGAKDHAWSEADHNGESVYDRS